MNSENIYEIGQTYIRLDKKLLRNIKMNLKSICFIKEKNIKNSL